MNQRNKEKQLKKVIKIVAQIILKMADMCDRNSTENHSNRRLKLNERRSKQLLILKKRRKKTNERRSRKYSQNAQKQDNQ